jgi:hypothetical protein
MPNKLIFVSCGQLTAEEKNLGTAVKAEIDRTPGLEGYFAETVHDLAALAHHVFDALWRCAGAVLFLHERGIVTTIDGKDLGHRSSVWVNQELAILAYRQFFEARQIPILLFKDPRVRLEGAMSALIVNPHSLGPDAEVVASVRDWLAKARFTGTPDETFQRKWADLPDSARRVVASLIEEGGSAIKEVAARKTLMADFGMDSSQANEAVRGAKPIFINTDLVKLIDNIHSGDELTINPTWEHQLRRATAKWLESERKVG